MKQTCYLFGSKSLLIQCFQVIQEQGFEVKAVVSDDEAISQWATDNNISVYSVAQQQQLLSLGAVDYIFSITHLKIIPTNILKLANNTAINFHDGLLPGYAGLNVTTWAILNQEKEHGITWHEMTDAVDEGQILKQVKFEIDSGETAFTLNAKCYESALSSFKELVNDIVNNSVTKSPQDAGQSTFYRGCQRVAGMAVLNWNNSVEKMDATIRALHFGPYSNPISLPKIILNNNVFYVHEAQIIDAPAGQAGQIMAAESSLNISANNGVIAFKNITNSQGEQQNIKALFENNIVKVGDVLPTLSAEEIAELTQKDEIFCKQEDNWLKQLQQLNQLVPLSSPESHSNANAQSCLSQNVAQLSGSSVACIQSYLTLFFSRLSCQSEFDLFFCRTEENNIKRLLIEQCVPVKFNFDYAQTINELNASCENTLQNSLKQNTYCKDLISRHPELNIQNIVKTVVIGEAENKALQHNINSSLLVAVNAQSASIDWHFNEADYSKNKISQLQTLFLSFINNAVENPQASLADTLLISNSEYDTLINKWNETKSEYDGSLCVHQLFEKQVEQTPNNIALSFTGVELTYSELNQKANQVAHYLLSKNVQPDQLVGVLLDRSIDMIVAMMGVLKSGAAYLPLDPTYPKDRIEYMLQDAQVAAVISQSCHSNYIENLSVNQLLIDNHKNTLKILPNIWLNRKTQRRYG